jgi:hypothetical protein
VPTEEEIDHVFHLTRVMWKAVLGLHHECKEQKKSGQLPIFKLRSVLIGYARISTTDQTLVKRNPFIR